MTAKPHFCSKEVSDYDRYLLLHKSITQNFMFLMILFTSFFLSFNCPLMYSAYILLTSQVLILSHL